MSNLTTNHGRSELKQNWDTTSHPDGHKLKNTSNIKFDKGWENKYNHTLLFMGVQINSLLGKWFS